MLASLVALAAVTLLATPQPPQPPQAIDGPILTSLSPAQVSLVWESRSQQEGSVVYGQQGAPPTEQVTVKSTATKVRCGGRKGSPSWAFVHRVTVDGLKSATAYTYHVTAGGDSSTPRVFTTPATHPGEIVFATYGDSRGNPRAHRTLLKRIGKYPVQFVLNMGDLSGGGASLDAWEAEYIDCLEGMGDRVPVYAARGNHDADSLYQLWCLPPGVKSNYSFDWGNAHFTCLDNVAQGAEGLAAAEKDLDRAKAEWKFVFYHVPTVNFGGHGSSWQFPEAAKAWDRLGVDFVLAGHSHLYERIRPVRATPESTRVTHYVTTGGGGAHVSSVSRDPRLAATASEHHFCLFTIKGQSLTLQAIAADGHVIDQLTLDKADPKASEALLKAAILLGDLDGGPEGSSDE
jgi:predicted phosphodiesterase